MPNSPQIMRRAERGGSLQPSNANAPADSPTAAIEQPNLPFPSHRVPVRMLGSKILKNAKATRTKTDDKTSLNSGGADRDGFRVLSLWQEAMLADELAEVKPVQDEKQHKAYDTKVAAGGALRRAGFKSYKRERERDSRLEKTDKEQQYGEYNKEDFSRVAQLSLASSSEGGSGYSPLGLYRPLAPHRSTYELLDCGPWSTHYTISQDHTSGNEAHEDSLLASFGKRRRTNKPSIPLGESRSLQRAPTLLTSLADGNDVVAQARGSSMQEISQDDLDFLSGWQPIVSKMPEDTVSFPQQNATTTPKERKDRVEFDWDDVKIESILMKERRHPVQSHRGVFVHRIPHSSLIDIVKTSGDRPPPSLNRQCDSCDRTDSREWKRGPNGAGTLCNACGLQYAKWENNRI